MNKKQLITKLTRNPIIIQPPLFEPKGNFSHSQMVKTGKEKRPNNQVPKSAILSPPSYSSQVTSIELNENKKSKIYKPIKEHRVTVK